MLWRIVTDSSSDIVDFTEFESEQVSFGTVPLKILVGETEYVDLPGTDVQAMLDHMERFKGPSASACPSPAEFLEQYRQADRVLVFAMTGALSGTYNCACQAREMAIEENPERQVFVLDSCATAGALVLLVRKAIALIQAGEEFDAICRMVTEYAAGLRMLMTLGSYDNLVKTGRMSKVAGLMAAALNIRAVAASTTEGTIEVLEKPRGFERAIERIVDLTEPRKGASMQGLPVVISHCGNPEGAKQMERLLVERFQAQVSIYACRCLTAFYTGRGGLLLSF